MNYFKIEGEVVKKIKLINKTFAILRLNVSNNTKNTLLDVIGFDNIAKEMYYEVKKGDIARFEGYIRSSCYEKNGKKIYKQDLVVESIKVVLTHL